MGIKTVNLVALRMLYALKILIFSRAVKKLKKRQTFMKLSYHHEYAHEVSRFR